MKLNEISYLRRFLGVIEGVSMTLPQDTQSLVFDYIAVVDDILCKEEQQQ